MVSQPIERYKEEIDHLDKLDSGLKALLDLNMNFLFCKEHEKNCLKEIIDSFNERIEIMLEVIKGMKKLIEIDNRYITQKQ